MTRSYSHVDSLPEQFAYLLTSWVHREVHYLVLLRPMIRDRKNDGNQRKYDILTQTSKFSDDEWVESHYIYPILITTILVKQQTALLNFWLTKNNFRGKNWISDNQIIKHFWLSQPCPSWIISSLSVPSTFATQIFDPDPLRSIGAVI